MLKTEFKETHFLTVLQLSRPYRLKYPCGDESKCEASYGFKHILPLVKDDKLFQVRILYKVQV